MIQSEVQNMMRDFDNRLRQQGMNLEMFLSFSGQTNADLEGQMKDDAENAFATTSCSSKSQKKKNSKYLKRKSTKSWRTWLTRTNVLLMKSARSCANGSLVSLREELLLRKTIDFLLENSVEGAPVEKKKQLKNNK